MFVSFYTELGNSSIADERVFLLHFILQQGIFLFWLILFDFSSENV